MLNYRNEASFSKAVVSHLRKKGWFVQRIETGSTGRGVPDIYAIDPLGNAWWIELKRVHQVIGGSHKDRAAIPWRPGQQAWLNTVTKRKQNACTLACFDDCILYITHSCIHSNDVVLFSKCKILFSISDL